MSNAAGEPFALLDAELAANDFDHLAAPVTASAIADRQRRAARGDRTLAETHLGPARWRRPTAAQAAGAPLEADDGQRRHRDSDERRASIASLIQLNRPLGFPGRMEARAPG